MVVYSIVSRSYWFCDIMSVTNSTTDRNAMINSSMYAAGLPLVAGRQNEKQLTIKSM